jgi:hypothetical protein
METPSSRGAQAGGSRAPGADPAKAEEVADQAKAAAGQVVEEVQRQVGARFAAQVERSAERVGGLSEALTAVGRELRSRDDDALASLTDRAADQVSRFAGYLRGKDLDEIVYEGEQFARRQPALFLGGAFLLGVAAARFLKASGQPRARGYGAPGRYGYPAARYMSRDYQYDAGDYDLDRSGYGRTGAVGRPSTGGVSSAAGPGRAPTPTYGAAPTPPSRPAAPTTRPSTTTASGPAATGSPASTPTTGGAGGPTTPSTGI